MISFHIARSLSLLLPLLVFTFVQIAASQLFWKVGAAGLNCDEVCDGYGTVCNEQELKDLAGEPYTACEAKFALAGYECAVDCPVNPCEPDNCRAWGSPYVNGDSVLQGVCSCGAGDLPARCRDTPEPANGIHRHRLCPCDGEIPGDRCEEFDSCHCFGDPHCSLTFWNNGVEVPFMNLGLFKYGSNLDGSLEVQGFNCPMLEGSSMQALAVRVSGQIVTIIKEDVALDGVPVTFDGSQPAWLSQEELTEGPLQGLFINIDAEDGCWHFSSALSDLSDVTPPLYWHEFFLDIAKQSSSSDGVCGSEQARDPVRLGDSLFSSAELERLYTLCPAAPQVNVLNDETPITSPEEVCQQAANITYEDASTKCAALITKNQFYQSCIYDYCATGLEAMVQSANLSAVWEVERSRIYSRGPITTSTTTSITITASTTSAESTSTLLRLSPSIALVAMQFYIYLSQ